MFTGGTGFLGKNIRPILEKSYEVTTCGITPDDMMQIFKEGGLNLPYLRIKMLLGEELPKVEIKYGVKMRRRYLEMFSKPE